MQIPTRSLGKPIIQYIGVSSKLKTKKKIKNKLHGMTIMSQIFTILTHVNYFKAVFSFFYQLRKCTEIIHRGKCTFIVSTLKYIIIMYELECVSKNMMKSTFIY